MPHFVIHCSKNVLNQVNPAELMDLVEDTAKKSELFKPQDIKVRILPFEEIYYSTAGSKDDFLHVFSYIRSGRSDAQKQILSKLIVGALVEILPEVPIVSLNILDFDDASYNNRATILNT